MCPTRILCLVLALWSFHAAAEVIPFAKGAARIDLPPGYTHALEDNGQTIVLRPAQKGLFEMRFTYHDVPELPDRPQVGREFVLHTAKQRGKQVVRFRGTRSIGFIERVAGTMVNGEEHRTVQGMMTLGRGYVSLTLSVPEKNVQRPELTELVTRGMDDLIAALRAGK